MSKNFLKKLQNFIFQEKLLEQGDKVLVGVSGGPDSIGLVLALSLLKEKYNLDLSLVHINYHQRSDASDGDQKFVEDFAKNQDLSLKVFDYVQEERGNQEELMRNFRYRCFEEARGDLNFDKIAVAHTEDDQVETFLMNLLRGSGLQGLTGMKARRDSLIRPFLGVSKSDILNFLKENKQEFRIDETNLKTDFTRNKVRLELIPYLEKEFNSNLKKGLGKLTNNLQDENELNDYFINQVFEDLIEKKDEKVIWNILKLKKLPIGGQKRLFRKIILDLKGDLRDISSNNFIEFKKIIDSSKSKKQTMKIGKVTLEKSGDRAIFSKVK